jgi:pyruvate formate-lyase activating enzyme-like uncharacterized protein
MSMSMAISFQELSKKREQTAYLGMFPVCSSLCASGHALRLFAGGLCSCEGSFFYYSTFQTVKDPIYGIYEPAVSRPDAGISLKVFAQECGASQNVVTALQALKHQQRLAAVVAVHFVRLSGAYYLSNSYYSTSMTIRQ